MQSRPVLAGEQIEVREAPTGAVRSDERPPYARDGDLLIVEKPSGMPTEPTRQASAGSLTHALREDLLRRDGHPPRFLAAVHRLDVETSGLVLLATHPDEAAALGQQFQHATVDRRYLALVDGRPAFESARLDTRIAKDRGKDGRYPLGPEGRAAVTLVQVLAAGTDASLLAVQPLTGRTHQIRAHLADAGHPVSGDVRYGGSPAPRGQFGLHALALTVERGGIPKVYAAPPPPAFYDLAAAHGVAREELDAAARAHMDPQQP